MVEPMTEQELQEVRAYLEPLSLGSGGFAYETDNRTARLLATVERLQRENMCDVCAGTGDPGNGRKCMCEGSGKISDAARYLRRELVIHEMVCGQSHSGTK